MNGKLQGRVKWFNDVKGIGFIESKGNDYFVHYSSLKDMKSLEEGAIVSFRVIEGQKGPLADEVEYCNEN